VIIPSDTTIAKIPLKGLKPAIKQLTIQTSPSQSYMHRLNDGVNILNPANINNGNYTITQQDQSGGSVSLSPASGSYAINQNFNVAIKADSDGESIRALQLIITYPYDQDLEPQSTTLTNLTSLLNFATKSIEIDSTNNLVKITLSAYKETGVIIPSGTTIATIPLKGLKPASVQITISKDSQKSYMPRLADGVDILNPANTQDGTYTITQQDTSPTLPPSNNVKIKFNFDGIKGQNKSDKILSNVTLISQPVQSPPGPDFTEVRIRKWNVPVTWSNNDQAYLLNLDLTGYENGPYHFFLDGAYHLKTWYPRVNVIKGNAISFTTPLPGGDLDGNGAVENQDLQILHHDYPPISLAGNCNPTAEPNSGFSCRSDINDDNYVNALDFSLLIKNLGKIDVEIP